MKRFIVKLQVLLISALAIHAHALSITEADAFSQGDKLAFHEYNSNLDWLDLDATGSKSFEQISAELNTIYSGWRLPTEKEILNLLSGVFDKTFSAQSNSIHWNMALFTNDITTHSFFPKLEAALSIMRSTKPVVYSSSGTQYFRQNNLYVDNNGIITQMEIVLYTNLYILPPNLSFRFYYETEAFGFPTTPYETKQGSILLVRDVPESSSAVLILLGLCILGLRKSLRRQH